MPKNEFVHLHTHSHYSLLDGASKIEAICDAAKKFGMPAVALTDHGNLFGAIEFYQRAIKTGVKPIVGYEAYVAPKSMEDRTARARDGEGSNHHLTLLVKNETGYKNLVRLASLAYTKGFYYKPRIDFAALQKHHEGLICLSGCLAGKFPWLAQRDEAQAAACAAEYKDLFGKDYYLELQDHGLEEQEIVNRVALAIAKRHGIPVVATQDAHYVKKEEAKAHDVLLAIATNRPVTDTGRMRFPNDQFYFKSADEMAYLFREAPEALANTLAIAERCALELDFSKQHLPKWEPPDGKTPPQYMRELCLKGFEERYPKASKEIRDRMEYELSVIGKMGFESYFLIVWDFIHYAKQHGIPVGPGRGSAAGSVVSYCLGITELDPLAYDLIFERFLNPGRKEMPDIDIDFCQVRREEVIDYVRKRYGKDNVGQIVTFSTLGAKAVVRNVGKAIGMPYAEQDALAKKIPFGPKMTLKEAMKLEPELLQLAGKDPRVKEVFEIGETLEGLAKATSVHAAGVVISDRPLTELVPIHVADGVEITQYPMGTLGSLGLLKMDFLGLQTLTILQKAVEIIRSVRKKQVDLVKLPLDDRRTYEMLARAETKGVFQLESSGMRDLLTKLKPDRFEDLIAVLALYRPGVIQAGGMIDTYIEVKHRVREASYPHPSLATVLRETNGVILYQEQVMRVAAELAGFSLADADGLRKAMGKKKPEIMEKYRQQFIDGAKKKSIDEDLATQIWNLLEHFGGYGFNKCVIGATTLVDARTGDRATVEELYLDRPPFTVHALGEDGKLRPRRVTDVVRNGRKPVFELTTSQGHRITATANHPFRTLGGWTLLGDLAPGDRIAAPRRINASGAESWPRHQIILLAGLLSEGNVCHPSCLYFFGNDRALVDDFARAAEAFPNSIARVDERRDGRLEVCVSTGRDARFRKGQRPWNAGGAVAVLEAEAPPKRSGAWTWVDRLGILGKKAAQKEVPRAVFRLKTGEIGLFLGRLWAGDGFFAGKGNFTPFYATSSPALARDVQTLLLRVGVVSGIHMKRFRYRGGLRTGYTVHLVGEGAIETFLARVAPHAVGRDKQIALLARHVRGTRRDRTSKDTIPPEVRRWVDEERRGAGLTWVDLEARSGVSMREFTGQGSRGKRGFRRGTIARLAAFFGSRRLSEISDSDVFWDRVVQIVPKGTQETYDLTVEEEHNFVADGLIVHNSHSAAYALVTYRTAYLKANYPVEYMAAVMTCERGDNEKVVEYMEECRRLGIPVDPPDINESGIEFAVKDGRIRFGLGAVRNVGERALQTILDVRARLGSLTSLYQLCEETDLKLISRDVLRTLVSCGAFDGFGAHRARLIEGIDSAVSFGQSLQQDRRAGQGMLFGGSVVKAAAPTLPNVPEWQTEELLAREKEALGFYVTSHPLAKYEVLLKSFGTHTTVEVPKAADGSEAMIGGVISELSYTLLKNGKSAGKRMAKFKLKDLHGGVHAILFPGELEKFRDQVAEDRLVFAKGKIDFRRVEEPTLKCDLIVPIERATEELTGSVTIGLKAPGLEERTILALKDLVLAHPGGCPLLIEVDTGDHHRALIRAAADFMVTPTHRFLQDVEELVGEGSVRLSAR